MQHSDAYRRASGLSRRLATQSDRRQRCQCRRPRAHRLLLRPPSLFKSAGVYNRRLVHVHFVVIFRYVFALKIFNWALTVDELVHFILKPLPEVCSKPELVRAKNT